MYCRHCGTELRDGASFCPACGAPVLGAPGRAPARRRDTTTGKVLLTVVIALVLIVSAVVLSFEGPVPDREVTSGDMTLRGELVSDDVAIVSDTGSGLISYTGEGTDVTWMWRDACAPGFVQSGSVYRERGYDEVHSRDFQVPTGMYEVRLVVDGDISRGYAIMDGPVAKEWKWSRQDGAVHREYTVAWTFMFSDYMEYREMPSIRYYVPTLSDARFAVVDDTLLGLEDALMTEYTRVHGTVPDAGDQDYADYLLSFVQMAIAYPPSIASSGSYYVEDDDRGSPDTYLYGAGEYWAYPLETLYMGMGDCEDTSFLACALFSAAGYESAVCTPPGHMMALVMIPEFTADAGFERLFPQFDTYRFDTTYGDRYWFCETTYDRMAVPCGYLGENSVEDVEGTETIYLVHPYAAA